MVGVKRIGLAAENAEGVVIDLPEAADEMLLEVQFRVIGPDPVGKEIKRQPEEEIGDQDKADEIVHGDGGAERHHIDQPDIADLHARQDHQDEADALVQCQILNRQRVNVESVHDAVPFTLPRRHAGLGRVAAGRRMAVPPLCG